MSNTLTVDVSCRLRNANVVKVISSLLGLIAPMLKPATVERIGNALLGVLRCEVQIGQGEWTAVDHGISVEAGAM